MASTTNNQVGDGMISVPELAQHGWTGWLGQIEDSTLRHDVELSESRSTMLPLPMTLDQAEEARAIHV